MAQSWLRTYPLRWLSRFLKFSIIPFSDAKSIRVYATRGYYLLGVLSAIVVLAFVALGIMSTAFHRLPEGARATFSSAFGSVGVENVAWMIPLALLFLYLVVFIIVPLRLFIGELTANLFFGTIDLGIRAGEWCLQHRWSSLFIVIALASFISWGVYSLFENKSRVERLTKSFDIWLVHAEFFLDRNTFTEVESEKYLKEVEPLWNNEYASVIQTPGGQTHPAFAFHEMLHEVFSEPPPKDSNLNKYLTERLEKLKRQMSQYQARPAEMTDTEKRAWALMNIFMGRIYSRLGGETTSKKLDYLLKAKGYFQEIAPPSSDRRPANIYDQKYQDAAHNGLGTLYANVLTPPLKNQEDFLLLCGGDAHKCANDALNEYAMVKGDECSYEVRRRENNRVDILAQIGINYDRLDLKKIDNLSDICEGAESKAGLADCIDKRLKELMECEGNEPFIPVLYRTVAQAYGVSAELWLEGGAPPEARLRATAAGKYLGFAYAQSKEAQKDIVNMKRWGLCYFRFAWSDKVSNNARDKEWVKNNKELRDAFWQAIEFRTEPLRFPKREDLQRVIDETKDQCRKTP